MKKIIILSLFIFLFSPLATKAETTSEKLAGKILLQVEKMVRLGT